MKEYAFKVSHVTKTFNQAPVLDDISFTIRPNTKLAILGHNGSGKSSLLKLIAGLSIPTSGTIDIGSQKVGYVPEHFPENIRFRLKEYLYYISRIDGLDHAATEKRIKEYSSLFQLESHMDTMLKHCSKGTRQKAGLIQAVMTDCDLLLLDEPLTGLDDESKNTFLDLIKSEWERDITLVFTAHEQETVESMAEEILVLDSGKIVRHDKITDLAKRKHIQFRISDQVTEEDAGMYGKVTLLEERTARLTVSERDSDSALLYLLGKGCSIMEVREELQ